MSVERIPADPTIDAIKARLAKITTGEWTANRDIGEDAEWYIASHVDGFRVGVVAAWAQTHFQYEYVPQVEQIADDAEFIAHAPTDVGWLLERVETLRNALYWLAVAVPREGQSPLLKAAMDEAAAPSPSTAEPQVQEEEEGA